MCRNKLLNQIKLDMKKAIFFVTIIMMLINLGTYAQVGINNDNSNPDPSAMLDVKATDKGILIPRMTTVQRTAIASPAEGLLVFDSETGSFWFYSNSQWVELKDSVNNHNLSDADGDTKIQVEKNPNDDVIRFDIGGTEQWVMTGPRLENRNAGGSILIGEDAGFADDTTNNRNIAIGRAALKANVDRDKLVAVGDSAMYNNGLGATAGWHSSGNTAVGTKALFANTIGSGNITSRMKVLELLCFLNHIPAMI